MLDELAIVTPWYPTLVRPFHGSFVQGFARTVVPRSARRADVLHLEAWGLPAGTAARRKVMKALSSLVGDPLTFPPGDVSVRHLPSPVVPGSDFYGIAAGQRRYLAGLTRGARLPHAVVHAHVGLGGGFPALEVVRDDAAFVVTEHATFLDRILADTGGRAAYAEVVARCDAFLCVSALLRDQVLEAFPEQRHKVHAVPNPVDFDSLPVRVTDRGVPRRWLYAGSLTKRKGVDLLVRSFALAQRAHGDLSLTLVGDGPEHQALQELSRSEGVDDAVHLVGSVAPDEMSRRYAEHDVLVHLSDYETFGMTIVEAVATGLPVIVTACGGPEETIGPVIEQTGELVARQPTPVEVAEAYGRLRERSHELDLAAARDDLRARYGREAVAARLADLYTELAT